MQNDESFHSLYQFTEELLQKEDQLIAEFNRIQSQFVIVPSAAARNLERWLKGLKGQSVHNVPPPYPVMEGELYLRQLPKVDPRGVFAGQYVDCCQHPQSSGYPCAWHGHESPDGAFWVIERNGAIIAVSWVWRHENTLVLDSLELQKGVLPLNLAIDLYQVAAHSVIGRQGVRQVLLGLGAGIFSSGPPASFFRRSFASPAPYVWTSKEGEIKVGDDSTYVTRLA